MLLFLAVFLLAVPWPAQEEAPRAATTLTLDDVLKLVHAGVSEEIIIARIKRFNKPFDLNSDEILELKKSGVSDPIIKCLLDPATPYAPPPPPAIDSKAPAVPPPPPKDPLTLKVPPEAGIYRLVKATPGEEAFERLEIKPVIPLKRGGKMGSMLSGGLVKDHTLGLIAGPKSKSRGPAGSSVFYARFDSKGSPDDLVLLRLLSGGTGREFDFGPKPDKPAFDPEAICPMENSEAGANVYRLSAPALRPGEYLLFILGSGDERKGLLGKGYDFAVQ
jgi:hypothetical protein